VFKVDDLLMGSGYFWVVIDARDHPKAGRLVRAFHGEDAKERAEHLAAELNGGTDGER
jgi:hypothetical protein